MSHHGGSFRRSGSFAGRSSKGGGGSESRKDVTSTELSNYHRLFTTFDVDNSGYLEFAELQFLLRCLGIFLDDETMEQLREEFDDDGNDLLDFEEFVNLMHRTGELSSLRVVSEDEERKHISKVNSKRFTAESRWRWLWDSLILAITGYYVLRSTYEFHLVVPFDVATYFFEILMTIIFMVDIGIYANTAYQDSTGKSVENIREVVKRYLFSFAIFDVIGTLPLDLLYVAADPSGYTTATAFRVLRGMRLFRIIRVAKTLYLSTSITGLLTPEFVYFSYHVTPVLRSLFFLWFSLHVLTVGWLIVKEDPNQNYIDALYLVLFTVTTVGYGDIVIRGDRQKVYCCFLFLCGVLVNGIVISQMSVFMQKADIASERNDKMRETLAVLTHFDIPGNIQAEILSFQNHLLEHNLGSSHASLISSLPVSIQESLALFMKIKYISMVPMFESANHDCKIALAQCLINIVFRPQEFIIIAGETGKEMYFLGHGIADVIHPKGTYLATLRKGNFFGEIALIVDDAHRTASIKALTYCDVFRLEKRDFSTILKKFPAFRDSVKEQMEERVKQFQAQGNTNIIPERKKKALEKQEKETAESKQESETVPIDPKLKGALQEAQKISTVPHDPNGKKSKARTRFASQYSMPNFGTAESVDEESSDFGGNASKNEFASGLSISVLTRAKMAANQFSGGGKDFSHQPMAGNQSSTGFGAFQQSNAFGTRSSTSFEPNRDPRNQQQGTFGGNGMGNQNSEFKTLMDRMSRIENYLAEQAEGSSGGVVNNASFGSTNRIRKESTVRVAEPSSTTQVPSQNSSPLFGPRSETTVTEFHPKQVESGPSSPVNGEIVTSQEMPTPVHGPLDPQASTRAPIPMNESTSRRPSEQAESSSDVLPGAVAE